MKLLVNGHAAYAYTGGKDFDASLPCVVFIHGALHDHSAWTLLARWCAHHGHSVLALDLPGHGGSLHAPLGDVAHLADWLLALLDAAGVRSATLVGQSMGSLIALEAAARDAAAHPGRIAGLVMMARTPSISSSPAVIDSSPAIMRNVVLLPQPEGPTKTRNSPSRTSRSMPLMTSTLP